jgi:hypothetical protein
MTYQSLALAIILLIGGFNGASAADKKPPPTKPLPVPPAFATGEYGLTFRTPPGAIYCPLPADWEGSDHGTTIFLSPPRSCGGAGFPSSARGFEPDNTPRIDVYYQYWMGEDEPKPPPCHSAGRAQLFSKNVALCREDHDGMATLTVQGLYDGGPGGPPDVRMTDEVVITLVAAPRDIARYTDTLVTLAASVRPCSELWYTSESKKKSFVVGSGPRCPKDATWF